MPSVFSHPAVPVAIMTFAGARKVPLRLLIAGALFAVLPDLDVIGFRLGISYDHLLGHRGFFHSPIFALVASLTAASAYRKLHTTYWSAFLVLFLSMFSHGVLDAATNGGLGIAFLSPFSNHRYFFPWQPIAVSPFGLDRFLSSRGLMIIGSELRWVWAPIFSIGFLGFLLRSIKTPNKALEPPLSTQTSRGQRGAD